MTDQDHARIIDEQYRTGQAEAKPSASKQQRMAAIIQDLLATAELAAKRGDEQAQDEAIAKASALQLKYAVDDAMLAVGTQNKDELAEADFCTESNTPLIKAKRILINGVAKHNRGKAVLMGEYREKRGGGRRWDNRAKVRVYAHQSDLDFITMLYNSLIIQMQSMMAADERKAQLSAYWGASAASWRVSYAYGWVDRVLQRMQWAAERNTREADNDQPGTALVLRDRNQIVQDYVANQFGKLKKTNHRIDDHSEAGRRAGRLAAESADLGGKKVSDASRRRLNA